MTKVLMMIPGLCPEDILDKLSAAGITCSLVKTVMGMGASVEIGCWEDVDRLFDVLGLSTIKVIRQRVSDECADYMILGAKCFTEVQLTGHAKKDDDRHRWWKR